MATYESDSADYEDARNELLYAACQVADDVVWQWQAIDPAEVDQHLERYISANERMAQATALLTEQVAAIQARIAAAEAAR